MNARIETIKKRNTENRLYIMSMLGWCEATYFNYLFENAIDYLKIKCRKTEDEISVISQSSEFWGWWKNLHYQLDDEYVKEFNAFKPEDHETVQSLRECYYSVHDVQDIVVYPTKKIVEEIGVDVTLVPVG